MRWRIISVAYLLAVLMAVLQASLAVGRPPTDLTPVPLEAFRDYEVAPPAASKPPVTYDVESMSAYELRMTRETPSPTTTKYSSGWRWPVLGKISSRFSSRHPAIDIAQDCGTRVRASRNGTVLFAGYKNNHGGIQVWMRNGAYGSGYYHLSKEIVRVGQSIKSGETLGFVGSTGRSTGCHLHFEIWKGTPWQGYRVNPLRYL